MIDYEEKLRRLQCIDDANYEILSAEHEYRALGENAHEPFAGWSHDGEINVIYDRNGRVDHVTVIDDERAA